MNHTLPRWANLRFYRHTFAPTRPFVSRAGALRLTSGLQQLRAALSLALFGLLASPALAQATGGGLVAGGTNDPVAVAKGGFCGTGGLIGIITNPVLVGIGLALLIVAVGWAIKTGNNNATQMMTRGLTGAVVVLGGVAIAGAFVPAC